MIAELFYFAQDCVAPGGNKIIGSECLPQTPDTSDTLKTIFLTFFVSVGALAVILMIIAGIRYITARDDATKVQAAKNDIKYILIGLVIAGMGAAVVNWVIGFL